MEKNSTTSTTIALDLMTVAEAANYVGVSVRTIERHVLLTPCPTEWTVRNNRKVKAYPKYWLDKHFNKSNSVATQNSGRLNESRTEKQYVKDIGTTNASEKSGSPMSDSIIRGLREENLFLKKEMDAKNQQILAMIKSDEQTRSLLADMQFQNKNLQLNAAPKQKAQGKES